nr:hypothetical protein GCM10025730_20390 [Promicromonospora thailandica]
MRNVFTELNAARNEPDAAASGAPAAASGAGVGSGVCDTQRFLRALGRAPRGPWSRDPVRVDRTEHATLRTEGVSVGVAGSEELGRRDQAPWTLPWEADRMANHSRLGTAKGPLIRHNAW